MRIVLMGFSCWLCVLTHGAGWAASEVDQNKTWSFRFEATPIREVLNQLSEVTGIEIFADKLPETKSLTRTYNKVALDQIIKDIFRGTNHVIIWHDGDHGNGSVEIHVFDKGPGSPGTIRNFPTVSRIPPRNPQRSLRRPGVAKEKQGRKDLDEENDEDDEDDEDDEEDLEE